MLRNLPRCLSPSLQFRDQDGCQWSSWVLVGQMGSSTWCSSALLYVGGSSVQDGKGRKFCISEQPSLFLFFLKLKIDSIWAVCSAVWPYIPWIFSLGLFSGTSRPMVKSILVVDLVLQQPWQWVHQMAFQSGQDNKYTFILSTIPYKYDLILQVALAGLERRDIRGKGKWEGFVSWSTRDGCREDVKADPGSLRQPQPLAQRSSTNSFFPLLLLCILLHLLQQETALPLREDESGDCWVTLVPIWKAEREKKRDHFHVFLMTWFC